MMMKKILLMALLSALVFAGCRSSQPVTQQYYLLEMPSQQEGDWPERLSALQGSTLISNATVVDAYASHQIALREDTHQIRYFNFNEWAIRPEHAFTQLLLNFYQENQVFEEVKHGRIVRTTDYILNTHVQVVELDMRGDLLHARLKVDFLLLDGQNEGDILHHYTVDSSKELDTKNLNSFASTISHMFIEGLHAFSVEMLENKPSNRS